MSRTRGSRSSFVALLASLSIIATGLFGLALAAPASAAVTLSNPNSPGQSGAHKITICHRTNATKNPYVSITVDQDAADGNLGNDKGNGDHYANHLGPVWNSSMPNGGTWGDIIPPIPGVHGGRNWDEAGQAIYNNGCRPTTPVTIYRTVYWCEATVLTSREQSSTDGGTTWSPSAPEDATTDSTLTCGEIPSGTVPGGTFDYCYDGDDGSVSWDGATYGEDADYETKAEAVAAVALAEAAAMEDVPDGAVAGTCTVEPGTVEGGTFDYCYEGADGSVSWNGATYGPDGDFATEAEAVQAVQDAEDAAMENVPSGAVPGTCTPGPDPDPVTYTDKASVSASEDICTGNGTVSVDVKGSGLGSSTVSQADATTVAQLNAQLDLAYNLRMAKAQFPGATEGACAPVVPPVVEAATVEEPATVVLPAKATVNEVPEAVTVPAKATVPTAVPAGDGSSSSVPAWALALIAVGALGALASGIRARKATR